MPRLTIFSLTFFLFLPQLSLADEFDWYTNSVLAKVPEAAGVLKVKQLTPKLLAEHSSALKGVTGTLVVMKTNEGNWTKLVVFPAQQKISAAKSVPILLIDRFVTYKEGEDRTVHVQGKNIRLFGDFVFNLDIGQVVPAEVNGDLHFRVGKDGVFAEAVGKAELYVVTKSLPEAKPDASAPVVVGATFSPEYFTGVYKLYDDGRRSGTLHLTVRDDRVVVGHFYSDKDGKKYELNGKVEDPHHKIQFKVFYPRTVQVFYGWMFTGDGKAFSGWAKMENQESGFYALRLEEKKAHPGTK